MNYRFPLLPAPGADDDCSGTVSILEAFRVLAETGYVPENGPVEFHWYAAEEGGLLGSQRIARYKLESGANIGAMMEFVCISGNLLFGEMLFVNPANRVYPGYDCFYCEKCHRIHRLHRNLC
jgi:Zn-dependent M28 family amino/carboxypeptidase